MEKPQSKPKIRPYWHVDAKWVCGILFAILLTFTLTLASLDKLTSKDVAIPLATEVVAQLFSRNGLHDKTDIDAFKEKAAQQPGEIVEPLPGAKISKTDLNTLSPKEIRLKIFEQIVRPYYELGVDGVAQQQSSDPARQQQIKQQAGLLGILNAKTHTLIHNMFVVCALMSLIPLLGLVGFSKGFGRLVSPGLVLVFIAAPLALLSQLVRLTTLPMGSLDGTTTYKIAQVIGQPFTFAIVIGIALLVAALIGKIMHQVVHRNQNM